ncbi:hypothetical protein BJV78DRAFT_1351939 [Lactifluus subvellereus]|nr:hypothetical protein BJV78DRAFT_1351939 [Lactifluus subvellereus]
MASVLKVLLAFLHKLYSSANYIRRFPRRLALFLAFLGPRFSVWLRSWHGESGTARWRSRPIEPPSPCSRTSSRTVSRGSPGLRENLVACSTVPTSPSISSLQHPDRGTRQPATTTPSGDAILPPSLDSFTADHVPRLTSSPDGRIPANLSSTSLRVHSSASDRHNIITHPLESFHTPVDQSSQLERGQGQDASQSRERQFRSSFPTDRPYDRIIPAISPADPPPLISVVADVHNSTTEPLPTSSPTNPSGLTDEPYVIGPPTAHFPPLPATAEAPSQRLSPASHVMSDHQLPGGDVPRLITSEQVPRYTKGITIPREETSYTIEPLTRTFPYSIEQTLSGQASPNQDCRPWISATHPGGASYFFDPERKLFTDTDMHDDILREKMEVFYDYLQNILRRDQLIIQSNNYDLVLDIMHLQDGQIQWSYYYACHETRCLFWPDKYDATHIISEVSGVKSPAHVKHRLEALYWNHWSLYPIFFPGRGLPVSICDELIGILSHGCVDRMTSSSSTLPYDVDTMQKMIGIVKNAKETDSSLEHHITGIACLLSRFAIWRFLYFHGQPHARLVSHQTVYSKPMHKPSSFRFKWFSAVLWSAPIECLRDIEELRIDDLCTATAWESFMNKKSNEWADLIFPATVMLAVNVSFLAIPGMVPSDSDASDFFVAFTQTASLFSIVTSTTCILLGLFLVRLNFAKPKEGEGLASTSEYLNRHTHWLLGRQSMAVFFSLPWALLMWSMWFFFVALSLSCLVIGDAAIGFPVTIVMCNTLFFTFVTMLSRFRLLSIISDDISKLKAKNDSIFASGKRFALSIFRPRSYGAHPTPHTPADIDSTHSMTERQDGAVLP